MPQALLTGIWIGMAALFGLLIGSFLNVCIYRLPAKITIVRGHSFCPKCRHPLGSLDLFPVLSYLLLKRRCRYCHDPISPRYARIELLTGAYFALAAAIWQPGSFQLPAWLANVLISLNLPAGLATSFQASLFLLIAAALAFSGLLIWAMIAWDEQKVPYGVFIFILIPVLLRLALQPGRLPGHLAAFLLSLLFVALIAWLGFIPQASLAQKLQLGAGVGLIGLMAGLSAVQPVLAVLLIELMLIFLQQRQQRRANRDNSRQVQLLWRSIPLQCLMIGAVAWLFF